MDCRRKEEDANLYQITRFDWIFIALILFFAIGSFLVTQRAPFRALSKHVLDSSRKAALIYQKNKLLEEANLEKNKIITILNGRMQIEIKDGKIRVLSSDCPYHVCKNMGWINRSSETIVCVPNQVLIEIKSKGPAVFDAVAY